MGKSMRAYSNNEDLALLSGINPDRVVMITWIIVGMLATIAGVLYGLDKSFKPFTYFQLLLPMFAAAIVGGIGNPLGAVAGGAIGVRHKRNKELNQTGRPIKYGTIGGFAGLAAGGTAGIIAEEMRRRASSNSTQLQGGNAEQYLG